jgi:molybdenum cofactor biosynthesis protein B
MGHQEHKREAPKILSLAVISISDSRTLADDESGRLIVDTLKNNGHKMTVYEMLNNDTKSISARLNYLLSDSQTEVIITTGGTGIGRRDITVETVTPLLDKKLDGFGELFRSLSYQEIGSSSIMSRALCGVAGGKVIICLPGSLAAVSLALDKIIIPEIGHLVREATR